MNAPTVLVSTTSDSTVTSWTMYRSLRGRSRADAVGEFRVADPCEARALCKGVGRTEAWPLSIPDGMLPFHTRKGTAFRAGGSGWMGRLPLRVKLRRGELMVNLRLCEVWIVGNRSFFLAILAMSSAIDISILSFTM